MAYAFCESIHAGSLSLWHIRKLTEAGPKFGGGIDTPSLCGHVTKGWDLKVEINLAHLKSCCPECSRLYGEKAKSEAAGHQG